MSRRGFGIAIVLMNVCCTPPPPCEITKIISTDSQMMEASCSGMSLSDIPPLEERELITKLDVSHNNITSLKNHSFSGYENVESIDLKNNKIETIEDNAFRHLKYLTRLYLSGNNLTVISSDMFTNCSRIHTLSLSHNSFLRVTENPLLISPTLDLLDLSYCQIRHLPANVFSELPNVTRIDVSNNNLTSLNRLTFQRLHRLGAVKLDSNPLMCTCELTEVSSLFREMKISLSPEEIVCFMGRVKMNITTVIREKSCQAEVSTVQRDVSVSTGQPTDVENSRQSTTSQVNHTSQTEARSKGDEMSTKPEEEDFTEEPILLSQNVSKLRELVLDIRGDISALKTLLSQNVSDLRELLLGIKGDVQKAHDSNTGWQTISAVAISFSVLTVSLIISVIFIAKHVRNTRQQNNQYLNVPT